MPTLFITACPVNSIAASLGDDIRSVVQSASKPFVKTLAAVVTALDAQPASVFQFGDIVKACRSLWGVKDWLAGPHEEHAHGT